MAKKTVPASLKCGIDALHLRSRAGNYFSDIILRFFSDISTPLSSPPVSQSDPSLRKCIGGEGIGIVCSGSTVRKFLVSGKNSAARADPGQCRTAPLTEPLTLPLTVPGAADLATAAHSEAYYCLPARAVPVRALCLFSLQCKQAGNENTWVSVCQSRRTACCSAKIRNKEKRRAVREEIYFVLNASSSPQQQGAILFLFLHSRLSL